MQHPPKIDLQSCTHIWETIRHGKVTFEILIICPPHLFFLLFSLICFVLKSKKKTRTPHAKPKLMFIFEYIFELANRLCFITFLLQVAVLETVTITTHLSPLDNRLLSKSECVSESWGTLLPTINQDSIYYTNDCNWVMLISVTDCKKRETVQQTESK